ncbi:MAG: ExbD/TolR family protein [Candidatus Binatia bacterium]
MDILDDRSLGGRRAHDPASALLEQDDDFAEILPPSQLRRSGRRRHTEAELNITSFVDVLSVLLFFLLSVATMSKLGTHDVNLPQQTDDFTKESEVEVKNLSLSLAKNGLKLRGMLTPKEKEPEILSVEIPVLGDTFDLQKLRQELLRLKSGYKTDDAIILLVADDVPFDSIVKVMDTVREQVEFADGRRNITNLFPQISLSDYLLDRVDQQIAAAPPEKS